MITSNIVTPNLSNPIVRRRQKPLRYMPPEWCPHQACWVAWPCRKEIWSLGFEAAKQTYAKVINAIAQFEPVNLLVRPEQLREAMLQCSHENVQFFDIELNDSWLRDVMPIFVQADEELVAVNWRFNAWGEKFQPYDKDAELGKKVAERFGFKSLDTDLVLEGGSIHVDGLGTLLTTSECLQNPNRNPLRMKAEIESILHEQLGVDHFIWLQRGIYGDTDTDGHIDNIACFVENSKVVTMTTSDPFDPNFSIYQTNREILLNSYDAHGNPIQLIEIEQPPRKELNGNPLALSYINYYLPNNAVIMPGFNDSYQDDAAKEALHSLYPNREVIQIDILPIVAGGGGIHCITMQQPALPG